MKRRTFPILLMLLLGVVTTVGVAWGFTFVDPTERGSAEIPSVWTRLVPPSPDSRTRSRTCAGIRRTTITYIEQRYNEFGSLEYWINREWRSALDFPAFESNRCEITWIQSGLPLVALGGGEVAREPYSVRGDRAVEMSWSIRLFDRDTAVAEDDMVPLLLFRPIVPGVLINTLFYGAIWFGLIFGGRAHMRVIRRWQGHCPMCKYDLRGDMESGCPECGWNREP